MAANSRPLRFIKKPQIFMCHSSLDERLLDEVESVIRNENVEPFIAERKIFGENPAQKVIMAMFASDALFAILTKNALEKQSTRDWVFFEIGLSKGMWKRLERKVYYQYRIFGWKDDGINLSSDCPLNFITDYRSLEPRSKMLGDMKTIAKELSNLAHV